MHFITFPKSNEVHFSIIILRIITIRKSEKSNCFGLAFADGDYWFWDNTLTTEVDEFAGFLNMRDTYYETCSKVEATMAIIYNNAAAGGGPIHAGIVNSDGTYTAKGGVSAQGIYSSEANFRQPNGSSGPQYSGEITYYKPKN